MKKNKYETFLSSYYTQLISVITIILFLLMISIVLINDSRSIIFKYDAMDFASMLFFNIIIGSAVFSYSTSKNSIEIQLDMGITRNEIFSSFVKRIVRVLFISILLVIYVVVINDSVNHNNSLNIFNTLKEQGIIFIIGLFGFTSFGFFLLGLLKINEKLMYVIVVLYSIIIFVWFRRINYIELLNSILIILTITLAFICKKTIEEIEVKTID